MTATMCARWPRSCSYHRSAAVLRRQSTGPTASPPDSRSYSSRPNSRGDEPMLDRRRFLSLACAGGALLIAPRLVFTSVESDRRFIFIIQRGAADGLHIVSPYGDPDYAKMRGALAVDPATATKLNSSFALHPALTETAKMYQAG